MKKILCLTLAFSLSFSTLAFASTTSTKNDSSWSNFYYAQLAQKGVTIKTPLPNNFVSEKGFVDCLNEIKIKNNLDSSKISNKKITRQKACEIIFSVLSLKESSSDKFKDVKNNKGEINAVSDIGIVNGYKDGTFKPDNYLTQGEMVAIIDNICNTQTTYLQGTQEATAYGNIKGDIENDGKTLVFKGVPYAKAPVGNLRWKKPVNPSTYYGVINADKFGSKFAQGGKQSEDGLFLNIYRPNNADTNLPVMVYFHGGNNVSGDSSDLNGTALATSQNCIVVSANYRLGLLGFANLPALKTGDKLEDSGNFGLLDQAQVFDFVAQNISSFGGDSKNITAAGFSAGARDVLAMTISPLFKGKFQKAFASSGGFTTSDPQVGQRFDENLIAKLLIEDGKFTTTDDAVKWLNSGDSAVKDYLYNLPASRISSLIGDAAIRMNNFPHLFRDGNVIPQNGFDVVNQGTYNKVPMLIGSESSEFSVFEMGDPLFAKSIGDGSIGKNPDLIKQFLFAKKYGSLVYSEFNGDKPSIAYSSNGNDNVYTYRFYWGENPAISGPMGGMLGSFHGDDQTFLSENFPNYFPGVYTDKNLKGRSDLSQVFQNYVGNFVKNGNPNGDSLAKWNTWANGSPNYMKFDATNDKAVVESSTETYSDDEIFDMIDKDTSITADEKTNIIKNVLNGRFFSQTLDAHYNINSK